jgi:hypothetical protein
MLHSLMGSPGRLVWGLTGQKNILIHILEKGGCVDIQVCDGSGNIKLLAPSGFKEALMREDFCT